MHSLPRTLPGVLLLLAAGRGMAAESTVDFFEKSVRPLLVSQCLACHSKTGMGGLRLDTRTAAVQGGGRGAAIVPGHPEQSLLMRAVRHTGDLKMPPGAKLKDTEIAILARWIQMGAPWGMESDTKPSAPDKFWAFVPPREAPLPPVQNQSWVRSPIDRFVLARLEEKGLTPAPPADKRTLIRRATYDLTGLPPTPEEIRAFLADDDPEAFARVVNRLLASPRYGERWGRHWLDVARYADSNGLDENLVYKNAFRYRDYVIAAFNKDKPYDQFVHEQLAGDLLPAADLATTFERWTATGFLSLGAKMLAEDDPVKMEMDIVDEQLDTASRAFMGLTVGCARCHDHKFDPIPTADYYSLAGIFRSSKTMENFKVVAKWHEFVLAPEADRKRLQEHLDKIEAKQKEIDAITRAANNKLVAAAWSKVGSYLLAAGDLLAYEKVALIPVKDGGLVRKSGSFDRGNVPRELAKGKANAPTGESAPQILFAEYDVEVPSAGEYQIDMLEEEKGRGTADLRINGTLCKAGAEAVQNRAASPEAGGWTVTGIFPLQAGKNTLRLEHKSRFPYFAEWRIAPNPLPASSPIPRTPVQVALQYGINPDLLEQWVDHMRRSQGAPHSVLFAWNEFGRSRQAAEWTSPAAKLFTGFQPNTRQELAAKYEQLFLQALGEWQKSHGGTEVDYTREERYKQDEKQAGLPDPGLEALRELLYEKYGPFRPPADARQYFPEQARNQIKQIEAEKKKLEDATPEYPRAMGVTENTEIRDLAIHVRGSHWTLGPVVPRRFLRAIAGDEPSHIGSNESGRLQLARWLTGKDHPLTSRVMANRIWRWHFGRGIVPSTDNFGRLGEKPDNQPLLDWLALRFMDESWSIKQMHRLIMLSNTYQMSSAFNEKGMETDPENTRLWRMSRQRLEAEEIRDALMAVSGDLNTGMGGSILNFKDRQYVANTANRGGIDYDRNLRAVYIPVVRSSVYDLFQAFDLPDPATSSGDRNATVVAPQALFMMNGQVMLKDSRMLAARLIQVPDVDDSERVRQAYERALGRLPSAAEIDRALTFIGRVDQALQSRHADAGERRLLAWQSFCKALLGSNEFAYLN